MMISSFGSDFSPSAAAAVFAEACVSLATLRSFAPHWMQNASPSLAFTPQFSQNIRVLLYPFPGVQATDFNVNLRSESFALIRDEKSDIFCTRPLSCGIGVTGGRASDASS